MNTRRDLWFEDFRLDRRNQEVRRGSRVISLRPKPFALLQFLAENPGRLVTPTELSKAVWGSTVVSDGLLRNYVMDVRRYGRFAHGTDAAYTHKRPPLIAKISRAVRLQLSVQRASFTVMPHWPFFGL
jgi:hypothetical protein